MPSLPCSSPAIEQPKPDGAAVIDGIIDAMTRQSEIVAGREHHAVFASHPKRICKVAVRFARRPGEIFSDRIPN